MSFVISEIFLPNANQLCSKCIVIDPLTGGCHEARAIWDTGATCSCISSVIAKNLNLPVVGSATSSTANGSTPSNRHVVELSIGNIRFSKIDVTALNVPDDVVLIGMDLIGLGKFTVENTLVNGTLKKVLTLELP